MHHLYATIKVNSVTKSTPLFGSSTKCNTWKGITCYWKLNLMPFWFIYFWKLHQRNGGRRCNVGCSLGRYDTCNIFCFVAILGNLRLFLFKTKSNVQSSKHDGLLCKRNGVMTTLCRYQSYTILHWLFEKSSPLYAIPVNKKMH